MNKKYREALDHIHFSENLDENILNYLEKQQQTAYFSRKNNIIGKIGLTAAAAACAIMLFTFSPADDSSFLYKQGNVAVRLVTELPESYVNMPAGLMMDYTESELFNNFNTDLIKGKVVSLKTVEIRSGNDILYQTIAEIKVEETYRGKALKNSLITILLPGVVDAVQNDEHSYGNDALLAPDPYYTQNISQEDEITLSEDKDTLNEIAVGMVGIFMPVKYTDKDVLEIGSDRLKLSAVAEYGLPDGARFAFLETKDGLALARYAYPSLEKAEKMEDVADFIRGMLKQ